MKSKKEGTQMVFTLVVGTILVAVAVDAMFANGWRRLGNRNRESRQPATFLAVDGPRTRLTMEGEKNVFALIFATFLVAIAVDAFVLRRYAEKKAGRAG
jgi:heme/copper-type cytochrome/quinol oxidase subunit 4